MDANMEQMSYTEAKKELTEIVTAIETGELDVDALTKKVKRATELILFCRTKLTHTDEELQKILNDIT
jgi:exodeoxyribonuclease VII small subunit